MVDTSADRIDVESSSGRAGQRFEFPERLEPGVAVVEAVAAMTGGEPTTGPPLGESIDTDALDRLLDGSRSDAGPIRVTFEYHGYEVTVERAGTVVVTPLGGRSE